MLLSRETLLPVRGVESVTRDPSGGIWLELIDASEKGDVMDEGLRSRANLATAAASVSVANVAAVIEMGEPEK